VDDRKNKIEKMMMVAIKLKKQLRNGSWWPNKWTCAEKHFPAVVNYR